MRRFRDLLGSLLAAPVLLLLAAVALLLTDLAFAIFGRRRLVEDRHPDTAGASVVIPNWNGRDLLERYLPSVVEALAGQPKNEIIVVDNGSDDGSADLVRSHFPGVRVVALPQNLGFGGGANAGFRAAKNDVVVLLNSDMRVQPDFLKPLLDGFTGPDIFAVSCQIFLSDPAKRREETGLTEGWWENGKLRVSHREDPQVTELFPCFYPGGGSAAFDRRKFLELGGFDELFRPFYLEDTDLGFLAWKRGWKVFYEPRSVVFHEHRGTIGRRFTPAYVDAVLKKNYLLFAWKHMDRTMALSASCWSAWMGSLASAIGDNRPLRTTFPAIARAAGQLTHAVRARWSARRLAAVPADEAFRHSQPAHFRDRFLPLAKSGERLKVLFVSPYPILPTVHGGAVFMNEALRQLSKRCDVHAVVLLDRAEQATANRPLEEYCQSVQMAVRPRNRDFAAADPHAVTEFRSREVQWIIGRTIYQRSIDVLQVEYTPMGQYIERFRRIATALFEHDVYFQSVARTSSLLASAPARWKARFEYLRALRFELKLLAKCDQVQVCTPENRDYLVSFVPELKARIHAGLRACIDAQSYAYPGGTREPNSILFIGSARHQPNRVGVEWFLDHVFETIAAGCPEVRVYLAGFDAEKDRLFRRDARIELLGTVENVKPLLESKAVFVCPILSGSGVRVKLLEAFASGIPTVSTRIGAEGLTREDGEICCLADTPREFAERTLALLRSPAESEAMAARARQEIMRKWDSAAVIERLAESYRDLVRTKNRPMEQASDSDR